MICQINFHVEDYQFIIMQIQQTCLQFNNNITTNLLITQQTINYIDAFI